MPGYRLRPERRALLRAQKIRDCQSAARRARNAYRSDRASWLAGVQLWIAMAGLGGHRRCRFAAVLRTFTCQSGSFEQAGPSVFHRERLSSIVVPAILRRPGIVLAR